MAFPYICPDCKTKQQKPGRCQPCFAKYLKAATNAAKNKHIPKNIMNAQGKPFSGRLAHASPYASYSTGTGAPWGAHTKRLQHLYADCKKCGTIWVTKEYKSCPTCAMRAPAATYMGEGIIGIRLYTIDPSMRFLRGGWGAAWYSPRQHAKCKPRGALIVTPETDGPAPHVNHRCGINAYLPDSLEHETCDFKEAASRIRKIQSATYVRNQVAAICQLWGTIMQHEDGVRASDCRVIALVQLAGTVPSATDFVLRNPAWKDVKVHTLPDLDLAINAEMKGGQVVYVSLDDSHQALIRGLQEIALQYATPLTPIPESEA